MQSVRTLLFVDDHPIYRDGFSRSLFEHVDNIVVLTEATCSGARDRLGSNAEIDLCLADYRLQDGDGLTLITELRRLRPLMAVGLLCADPTSLLSKRVRDIGGIACLSKERDTEALITALESLFRGHVVFDDGVATASIGSGLSIRRREILLFASEGLLDKQIGERLGVTESAIRNHWQHIFARMDVSNRTEAVTKALRMRLI